MTSGDGAVPGPATGRSRGRVAGARAVLLLAVRAAPLALLGIVLATLLGAALPVLAAWLTRDVLDLLAGAGHGTAPRVAGPAAALAGTGVAAALLPHLERLLSGELARSVGLAAQDRLYARVNGFSGLARFEDPAALDRLRLAEQCGQDTPVQIVTAAVALAHAGVTVSGFVVSLWVINPHLAGVVLLGALPALAAELRLARAWSRATLRTTSLERRESFYAHLLGSVEAAKEIRLFGIGGHLRRRMRRDREAINAVRRRMELRTTALQALPAVVSAGIAAAGLVWAVRAAARGDLTVGDLVVLTSAIAAVQGGLAGIAASAAVTHQHLLLFEHYLDVTTAPPDLPVPPQPAPLPRLRRGIELRDVWFRYSEQHDWVLRGVSLTIPYGGTLALVGDNGAGKSTLVKLLCRFYDPTRGSILWDGTDIRHVDPDQLRRRIGAVFQDFVRYDLTAAENIALGQLDRAGKVASAATAVGVHDTLAALPRGYDTLLSRSFGDGDEEGVELSGGQWQRVALARAFLRDDPDLLILDEPASGLDPEAEHEVAEAVRRHRRGRTSLLISHRLGAAREADLIVVLRRGRVVEHGGHAELVAANGRYARLFHRQAAGYTR
ncbi:multidrug ABC transporter permease [Streptomyces lucensis JCM 4490]|uniref:Multidrug ABC transporter permease n=1 Tax=Streptomyces lucensis JCM 4490 TaxID=1306176 RepID=A0A918J093_9ACTN|nr:ABC transporter ATP-binding protein [Streptomyces lucensis]GGW40047.1 multidrug ABC transporter permease [Streptomyces lucensis JCM 4490]